MFEVSNKKSLKIPQSKYPPERGWLNKPQSILPMKFHAAIKKEECSTCGSEQWL